MGCRHAARRRMMALKNAPIAIMAVLGEVGLTKVRSTIARDEPVTGTITEVRYPFHQKAEMFVDNRDLITMIGNDIWIVE